MPRAKTPPEGGTGGFFVRGGVQTSTMKKSDNVDDHVFMPGEKIGEAFHLSAEEKKPVVEPDNDGVEGFDRDMRDAKRAANGKFTQSKGTTRWYNFETLPQPDDFRRTAVESVPIVQSVQSIA